MLLFNATVRIWHAIEKVNRFYRELMKTELKKKRNYIKVAEKRECPLCIYDQDYLLAITNLAMLNKFILHSFFSEITIFW